MRSKGFDTGSVSYDLDNYYNSACGSNGAGFLKSYGSSAASETTGWSDRGYAANDLGYAYFPYVGGYCGGGANAGLFCARVAYRSPYSNSGCCARLSFRG